MKLSTALSSICILGAAATACGDAPKQPSAPPPAPPASSADAGSQQPLGLNDVTILVPLPDTVTKPVLLRASDPDDDGAPLLPRDLFDRVLDMNGDKPIALSDTYAASQLTAVRFDPCHHGTPAPCTPDLDGRVRLVFQPLDEGLGARDVGVHVFYTVPATEVADAVAELRELAALAAIPPSTPLRVSPALQGGDTASYVSKLTSWLTKHARASRVVQVTINARPIFFAQVRWIFKGIEKRGDGFVDTAMVGATAMQEDIVFSSGPSYDVQPAETAPAGLTAALSKDAFDAADSAGRNASLALLTAVDDPTKNGTDTVSCAGCHASTPVIYGRAASLGIDPTSIPGAFASPPFDLSVAAGRSATRTVTLRSLGWASKEPLLSQRVVNESALVVREIEERFLR